MVDEQCIKGALVGMDRRAVGRLLGDLDSRTCPPFRSHNPGLINYRGTDDYGLGAGPFWIARIPASSGAMGAFDGSCLASDGCSSHSKVLNRGKNMIS